MTLTQTRRNKLRLQAFTFGMVAVLGLVLSTLQPVQARSDKDKPQTRVTQLVSGLKGPIGSTIGPDDALYVTEGPIGRISRINPQTGEITTFASGLPKAIVEIS